MKKKVSIITVNYNNCIGLERTVKSVLEQTYQELEYIVIDGGSTDGSKELIEEYSSKLEYWVSEPDRGIYHAMNKGIAKAKGEYLLFLNSGDYLCSSHILEDVFKYKRTADLLIGRQMFVDAPGKVSKSPRLHKDEFNISFFFSSTLPHQSTFIRKSLMDSIGGYDEQYKVSADWVFWIQSVVLRNCSTEILPFCISYMEKGGVSNDMEKCHADMSRYLNVLMQQGRLDWQTIFDLSLKARAYEFSNRSSILGFLSRSLVWLGKNV